MTMPTDVAVPCRIEYVEDGVTTVHPIPFKFIDHDDITVYRLVDDGEGVPDKIILIDPTHYSVTGGDYEIGQITKVGGGTDGATIRIDRNTKRYQPLDYIQGDDFAADNHERALDRLTMIVQELKRDQLTEEDVRDIIAAMLRAGPGIELDINDDGDVLTIINTYDADFIIETIANALVAGANISIAYNPTTKKITITGTGGGGTIGGLADFLMLEGDQQGGGDSGTGDGTFADQVLDIVYAALVGVGITIERDGDTFTFTNDITPEGIIALIAATVVEGTGINVEQVGDTVVVSLTGEVVGGVTLEQVRDMLATALSPGTLITIVPDDAGDVIVISTTALDPSYKGLVAANVAGAANVDNNWNGRAKNLTGAAADITLRPNADHALDSGWACVVRNNGSGVKVIKRGAGVALYKNGGTVSADAAIAIGGYATIQRWAADEFTISGPGVS